MASTVIIFPFTYMCTQYLHYIHPLMLFTHLPPAIGTNPLVRICSTHPPVPQFCKWKHFYLLKSAKHGISFWHLHIYYMQIIYIYL
jgi:hypothetical protein